MLIKTKILDESGVSVFQARTPIDAINLMLVAESKEDLVREKGEEWAAGAIPFFGGELINVMKAGELGKAVDKAAIELAMAVWLFDSIYCGLSPEVFVKCDLDLTMWHDGTVVCTRVLG